MNLVSLLAQNLSLHKHDSKTAGFVGL